MLEPLKGRGFPFTSVREELPCERLDVAKARKAAFDGQDDVRHTPPPA
jgi:hypothetical protein